MIYTKTYLDDIKSIQNEIPNLNRIANQKILVTGAGGNICNGKK